MGLRSPLYPERRSNRSRASHVRAAVLAVSVFVGCVYPGEVRVGFLRDGPGNGRACADSVAWIRGSRTDTLVRIRQDLMLSAVHGLRDNRVPPSIAPGITTLSFWRHRDLGSVLFLLERPISKFQPDMLTLHRVDAYRSRVYRRWRCTGGGGGGLSPEAEALDTDVTGLLEGGRALDNRMRIATGRAEPRVRSIRCGDADPVLVGPHGFFIVGVAADAGPSSAVGLDRDGRALPDVAPLVV